MEESSLQYKYSQYEITMLYSQIIKKKLNDNYRAYFKTIFRKKLKLNPFHKIGNYRNCQ